MNQPATPNQPNQPNTAPPMLDEADIGSGEKNPGQQETEEIIRQIPPLPSADSPAPAPSPTAPPRP